MHEGHSAALVVAATLESDGESPAQRAPERDVPPELDRLCRQATRRTPGERLTSAEVLSREIEAYLDGDRDVSQRRELAREHAARAEEALERSRHEGSAEAQERATAMREVSGALALDPAHDGARQTLVRLITEPPRVIPPEANAAIEQNRLQAYRMTGRAALLYYFGYLIYLPLLLWMGVRDWTLFAVGWASIFACVIATVLVFRYPPKRIDAPIPHLVVSTLTMAASSVVFGPFVFVPMLAVANAVSYMASIGHRRGLVPLAAGLSVIVPLGLQWLDIMPSNYSFENGVWTILPSVFYIRPLPTQLFLLAATLGTLLPACWLVHRLRKAYAEAEEKLQLQAWQLRQIIPSS